MLIKVKDEDKEMLLTLCKDNDISIDGIFDTSKDAFAYDEFDRIENIYKGIIGDDTIKRVRSEANDLIDSVESNMFYELLEAKLDNICTQLDARPLGVYVISNNMSISLLELNMIEDTATIKVGNDILVCDVFYDEDGIEVVKYGESNLPLREFMLV